VLSSSSPRLPSTPSTIPTIMQNVLPSRGNKEETKDIEPQNLTLDNIETALAADTKVKLAGLDVDGELNRALRSQPH